MGTGEHADLDVGKACAQISIGNGGGGAFAFGAGDMEDVATMRW